MKEEQNVPEALVVGKLYIAQCDLSVMRPGITPPVRIYPAGTLVVVVGLDRSLLTGPWDGGFVRVRLLTPDGEIGERADIVSTLQSVYRECSDETEAA